MCMYEYALFNIGDGPYGTRWPNYVVVVVCFGVVPTKLDIEAPFSIGG